jgi:hypothetical protein
LKSHLPRAIRYSPFAIRQMRKHDMIKFAGALIALTIATPLNKNYRRTRGPQHPEVEEAGALMACGRESAVSRCDLHPPRQRQIHAALCCRISSIFSVRQLQECRHYFSGILPVVSGTVEGRGVARGGNDITGADGFLTTRGSVRGADSF